jgi:hypothetical protein
LKTKLKNNGKKHVLVSNQSYKRTSQTNACLIGHCYRFHSDTLLLALLVSRNLIGMGHFRNKKKELKLRNLKQTVRKIY